MRDLFENEILKMAEDIQRDRLFRQGKIREPNDAGKYLISRLSHKAHEVFGCVFLDTNHHIIACEELFFGTIDSTEVHPREVLRRALELNAAAVIFFHNHPSGNPEPSAADRAITVRLKQALALIDVRVLDHLIVAGTDTTSMAARGLI